MALVKNQSDTMLKVAYANGYKDGKKGALEKENIRSIVREILIEEKIIKK